jgi:2-keto-4-pentenoate hydratase/2-oxohepta-3-ene-1,7-dioic acid hydratase in catechol pathway
MFAVLIVKRKPATALADPGTIILPKLTQSDNCGDYESELAVIIGKDCKNVSEAEAQDYILGYTASNDISSRSSQFAQSQWCFSKGFDESCPIGMQTHLMSLLSLTYLFKAQY